MNIAKIHIPYKLTSNIVMSAVVIGLIIYFMLNVKKYKHVDEGFYGGIACGSGNPDCLRTLPEGSKILDALHGVDSADYRELQLILSKLGCLKKDLMSPSGIVEATRYQAFETAHDRINVAEVCGMCLNQTIPSRDLDIVFATWRDRGKILIAKISTDVKLKEEKVVQLEELFNKTWEDVYDISKSRCLKTLSTPSKGDVGSYESENSKKLRTYDYKYGGLSASGWNTV